MCCESDFLDSFTLNGVRLIKKNHQGNQPYQVKSTILQFHKINKIFLMLLLYISII